MNWSQISDVLSVRGSEFVAQSRSPRGLDLAYALPCAVIYCAGVRAFSETDSSRAHATVDCLVWEPSRADGHKIGTISVHTLPVHGAGII
jgi:hypothetical protein